MFKLFFTACSVYSLIVAQWFGSSDYNLVGSIAGVEPEPAPGLSKCLQQHLILSLP